MHIVNVKPLPSRLRLESPILILFATSLLMNREKESATTVKMNWDNGSPCLRPLEH